MQKYWCTKYRTLRPPVFSGRIIITINFTEEILFKYSLHLFVFLLTGFSIFSVSKKNPEKISSCNFFSGNTFWYKILFEFTKLYEAIQSPVIRNGKFVWMKLIPHFFHFNRMSIETLSVITSAEIIVFFINVSLLNK